MHNVSALFETSECMLKHIWTYPHNIQMHCKALKYYFITFNLIVITQGNKLSTFLFDYMYWWLFAFIQAIQEKKNGPAFNCWIALHCI